MTSNHRLASEKLRLCDFILVTHSHWDHLMDVAEVVRNTGAVAYGSANTCKVLASAGILPRYIRQIEIGALEHLGNFSVEVLPARHIHTPIDRWINGAVGDNLSTPLRLVDYKMDTCFSLLVSSGKTRILFGNYPVRADILFINPNDRAGFYIPFIKEVEPSVIVPIHWDNFFSPLSRPIRPMLTFPAWILRCIKRNNLTEFKRVIEMSYNSTRVIIPQAFDEYNMD